MNTIISNSKSLIGRTSFFIFRRIGRQPLPISIYEYERSNRPPFHGSAISIITQALQLIKSLGLMFDFTFYNTFYKCNKRHRFDQAHLAHNAYKPTTLTMHTTLTIATKSLQFPKSINKTVHSNQHCPFSE